MMVMVLRVLQLSVMVMEPVIFQIVKIPVDVRDDVSRPEYESVNVYLLHDLQEPIPVMDMHLTVLQLRVVVVLPVRHDINETVFNV